MYKLLNISQGMQSDSTRGSEELVIVIFVARQDICCSVYSDLVIQDIQESNIVQVINEQDMI